MNIKKQLINVIILLLNSNLCTASNFLEGRTIARLPTGLPSPTGDVSHRIAKFSCGKFNEDYTSQCIVRIVVDIKPEVRWSKVACFGEIEYKQVDTGTIYTRKRGFLSSYEKLRLLSSPFINVDEWVYFPEYEKAMEPNLDWTRCEVIVYETGE